MASPTLPSTGMSFDDIKAIVWLAGAFVSTLATGLGVSWWFSQQLSNTRKDIYIKIDENHKGVKRSIDHNKDDCRDTKERVTLLELTKDHHEKKMDEVEDTLKSIKSDLSATKDSVVDLAQKAREDTHMIMGEIRSIEARHQLSLMELKESILFTVGRINSDKTN